jgi:hypothetical protein
VNIFRPAQAFFVCAFLLAGLATSLAQAAPNPPAAEQTLETLFELGLPDTRGAKWVRVESWSGPGAQNVTSPLFTENDYGQSEGGNAWLIREERDGMVDIVLNQTLRIRARKHRDDAGEDTRRSSVVQFAPADLDKDLTRLAAALQKLQKKSRPTDEDEGDYETRRALAQAHQSFLFLAHLHRQGKVEAVRKHLPALLAVAPSSSLLDQSLSAIAEARLEKLTEDWVTRGSAESYAKGIASLCGEFTRGWEGRDAALQLAERVRAQTPGAGANEPTAKQAASLLLALKEDQLSQLPRHRNWLLPGAGSGDEEEDEEEPEESSAPPLPGAPKPADKSGPIAALFAKKYEAAAALARLLDDHRLLRIRRHFAREDADAASRRYHIPGLDRDSDDEAYDHLPRPYELGELADDLLSQLYPEDLRERADAASKSAPMLAWLREVSAMNDEQLAWHFMTRADDANSSEFRKGLTFLVKQGGKDSMVKLQEVFTDPAVWTGGGDTAFDALEIYLKRFEGDRDAFAAKLEPIVKKAFAADQQAQLSNYGSNIADSIKKHYETQFAAQQKHLAQILHPRGYAEILEEIAAASEEDAQAQLASLQSALGKNAPPDAEGKIFQAAAKAKLPSVKYQLLSLLSQDLAGTDKEPPKLDPAARDSLLALLADEQAPSSAPWGRDTSVAEMTAAAVVWRRVPKAEMEKWQGLASTAPHLLPSWLKARATAYAKGETPPPRPDAARVDAAKLAALLAELGAAKPADALNAFRAKSPDEQLALVQHLEKAPDWPPSLIAAHLTIWKASADEGLKLDIAKWKGRQFNAALHTELVADAEKAALAGEPYTLRLTAAGTLGGVVLRVSRTPKKVTIEQLTRVGLAGLAGKAEPAAAVACMIQIPQPTGRGAGASYYFPVWKDAAVNTAWRAEHLKFDAKPKTEEKPENARANRNDPAAFQSRLNDFTGLKPGSRGHITLYIYSNLVGKNEPEPAEP